MCGEGEYQYSYWELVGDRGDTEVGGGGVHD